MENIQEKNNFTGKTWRGDMKTGFNPLSQLYKVEEDAVTEQ